MTFIHKHVHNQRQNKKVKQHRENFQAANCFDDTYTHTHTFAFTFAPHTHLNISKHFAFDAVKKREHVIQLLSN